MARKERNSVDYFPHSVNHGKKMFYLRDNYGNDGYVVWFMLLEQLGKADYHYLDLKDDVELMYLSSELKVSEEVLTDIIDTLVKFGEFDSDLWSKENILFNQKFVDNITDAYKKRNNDVIDKSSLRLLLASKGRLKPIKGSPKPPKKTPKAPRKPQSKVKYSKEEDIKGENKPTQEEFLEYALANAADLNHETVILKYKAWVENDWKDGNDNEVTNWKVKLLNTLPHMKRKLGQGEKSEEVIVLKGNIRDGN